MILDTLDRLKVYSATHERFAEVFIALEALDLNRISEGRHELDGDTDAFIIVMEKEGQGRKGAKLEAHRKYIDVQIVLSGEDVMGWRATAACAASKGYDEEKDVEFFDDPPTTWLVAPSGHFCIFFPEDAHAPLAGEGKTQKAVVKIPV